MRYSQAGVMKERLERHDGKPLVFYGLDRIDADEVLNDINMEERTLFYWVMNRYFPDVVKSRQEMKGEKMMKVSDWIRMYLPFEAVIHPHLVTNRRHLYRLRDEYKVSDVNLISRKRFSGILDRVIILRMYERNQEMRRPMKRSTLIGMSGHSTSLFNKVIADRDGLLGLPADMKDVLHAVKQYHDMYRRWPEKMTLHHPSVDDRIIMHLMQEMMADKFSDWEWFNEVDAGR